MGQVLSTAATSPIPEQQVSAKSINRVAAIERDVQIIVDYMLQQRQTLQDHQRASKAAMSDIYDRLRLLENHQTGTPLCVKHDLTEGHAPIDAPMQAPVQAPGQAPVQAPGQAPDQAFSLFDTPNISNGPLIDRMVKRLTTLLERGERPCERNWMTLVNAYEATAPIGASFEQSNHWEDISTSRASTHDNIFVRKPPAPPFTAKDVHLSDLHVATHKRRRITEFSPTVEIQYEDFVVVDSDDVETNNTHIPMRQSTRSKKPTKRKLESDLHMPSNSFDLPASLA